MSTTNHFNNQTSIYNRANSIRLAVQELSALHIRQQRLKEHCEAHFQKHWQDWRFKEYQKSGNAHALPFMMRHQQRLQRIDTIAQRLKQQIQYKHGLSSPAPRSAPHWDVLLSPEYLPW